MGVPGNADLLLLKTAAAAGGYQVSRSLRFNGSVDNSYLSRTPASAGNQKTWTWSGWVKRATLTGSYQQLFGGGPGSGANDGLFFNSSSDSLIYFFDGSTTTFNTSAQYRDPSAWYHIVLAVDTTQATASNRVKLYVNGAQVTTFASTSYPSQNADSQYINSATQQRIGAHTNAGYYFNGFMADIWFLDGIATDPSSFAETDATTGQWIPKAYTGSKGTNGFHLEFADNSAATAAALGKDTSGNSNNWTPNNFSVTGTVNHVTSGLSYRKGARFSSWDTSSADTTPSSSVAADNYWWVDLGSSKTINKIEFDATITGTGSADFYFLYSTSSSSSGSSGCPAGCTITATRSITGAAPNHHVVFTGFGSITGRYIGISNGTAGSSPTTFSNLRVLDDQGKDNDSLVDTPTSVSATDTGIGGEIRGNYCTLNPLNPTTVTLSNGNLDCVTNNAATHVRGTIGISSGKYYWECSASNLAGDLMVGICTPSAVFNTDLVGSNAWTYASWNGNKYTSSGSSYGATWTTGDVIGIAFDADNGTLTFYKNGTSQGQAFSSLTSGPYFPAVSDANSGASSTFSINFGQRAFAYTAPSGFKALCDTNLTAPVIAKPSESAFDVKLWTGTGSNQTITTSFSPDFVWAKPRSAAASHGLYDTVRGNNLRLSSNQTASEGTVYLQMGSTGFTVEGSTSYGDSGVTYVGWVWDAGSSTVTNTQGSITSSVRANASAGFSIVSYNSGSSTGNVTLGHGLNVAPKFIIHKSRSTSNWWVYHASVIDDLKKYMQLNSTNAIATNSNNMWGGAFPTSSVFGVTVGDLIATSQDAIAYVFSPVAGYSSFGSYTGTAGNTFVYTGFRPRLVMIKRTDTAGSWYIIDALRPNYNNTSQYLLPNASDSEYSDNIFDLLSNGFKFRLNAGGLDGSGGSYIYCAWAESPFQYARAR